MTDSIQYIRDDLATKFSMLRQDAQEQLQFLEYVHGARQKAQLIRQQRRNRRAMQAFIRLAQTIPFSPTPPTPPQPDNILPPSIPLSVLLSSIAHLAHIASATTKQTPLPSNQAIAAAAAAAVTPSTPLLVPAVTNSLSTVVPRNAYIPNNNTANLANVLSHSRLFSAMTHLMQMVPSNTVTHTAPLSPSQLLAAFHVLTSLLSVSSAKPQQQQQQQQQHAMVPLSLSPSLPMSSVLRTFSILSAMVPSSSAPSSSSSSLLLSGPRFHVSSIVHAMRVLAALPAQKSTTKLPVVVSTIPQMDLLYAIAWLMQLPHASSKVSTIHPNELLHAISYLWDLRRKDQPVEEKNSRERPVWEIQLPSLGWPWNENRYADTIQTFV